MNSAPPWLVIDTSVAAKWFLRSEPGADQARSLRDRHLREEISLCGPDLLLWELANVLRFKPSSSMSDVTDAVESTIDLAVRFFEPSPTLIRRAARIAYEADVTVYDAAFLALAQELGCDLVTADQRFVTKVASPTARLLSEM